MSRPPRVVIDTNLVLSALLFAQGRTAGLRRAWQEGRIRPLISTATAAELVRVLAYPKFKLSGEDSHELLADYLPHCTTVRAPTKTPDTPTCRDPYDVPFLQLAIAGRADYLVTGDPDLLSLAAVFRPPIITAEELLRRLAME